MPTKTLRERAEVLAPVGLSPLLTQPELEALYGVSGWTVRQWLERGLPTADVPLRSLRFRLADVEAWMTQTANAA